MKAPPLSLLALPLLSSTALAGDPSSTRFTELDRELASMTSALQDKSPMQVGVLLRTYFDNAPSDLSGTGEDVQGFRLYDAQIWVDTHVGDWEVFIKTDAAETSAFPPIANDGVTNFTLRDAWARTNITDEIQLYWGQYKCPAVASANVGDGKLSMIDRTRIGQLFSGPGAYQPGAALVGDWGDLHLKLAVQNGADGISDGWGIVARGEWKIGTGAKQREGALGNEGFNATFGLGYFKDDSQIAGSDFGSALALDAYVTVDAFSLHAEILDTDAEFASRALGNVTDDATPYSATAGILLGDSRWEALVRYQDLDNEVGATILTAGLNYYVSGHQTKWQVNVSNYDDDNVDGTIFQAGLSIGLGDPN